MKRRVLRILWSLSLVCAACDARQLPDWVGGSAKRQPGIPAVDLTPVSAASLDEMIAQVSRQIVQKHLKSIAVIGAVGPMPDVPTQFGLVLGDKFSAALAEHSQGFQVHDRAELREFVKRNRLSDVMVTSDGLASWIASKAGADGYVVIEITNVVSAGAKIRASLYRTGKEDGDPLSSSNTTIDLTVDQYTEGMRPIDSDWNKETYNKDELHQLSPDRQPSCIWCPKPEYTQLARAERASDETVKMEITVLADGTVGDIAVIKSSRYGLTARSVDTILKTWKFKPGLSLDGKPMSVRVPVEIRFQLF